MRIRSDKASLSSIKCVVRRRVFPSFIVRNQSHSKRRFDGSRPLDGYEKETIDILSVQKKGNDFTSSKRIILVFPTNAHASERRRFIPPAND